MPGHTQNQNQYFCRFIWTLHVETLCFTKPLGAHRLIPSSEERHLKMRSPIQKHDGPRVARKPASLNNGRDLPWPWHCRGPGQEKDLSLEKGSSVSRAQKGGSSEIETSFFVQLIPEIRVKWGQTALGEQDQGAHWVMALSFGGRWAGSLS